MSSITAQVLARAMAEHAEPEHEIATGTRIRIHAPFPGTQWMHNLTGEIVGPTTQFTGNGWTTNGDLYSVRLDDGDREVIDVFTSMIVQLSDDDPQDDDDEFECDDECCRGPQDGRDER